MNLADSIIKGLGIDPAQLQTALQGVIKNAQTVRDEVMAGKVGFQNLAAHFNNRLDTLDRRLANIERALRIDEPAVLSLPQPNGADEHGQQEHQ